MFGIGYQEMFVVLVVALVIFGPKRLPEIAGQVGRWVRDFRRMSSDLTGEFEKTFAEVDEVKKSFTRELQGIQQEVEGIGKSTRGDLKKSGAKAVGDGKKSSGLTGKKGTAAAATASNPARSTSPNKTSSLAKDGAANGALAKNGPDGRLGAIASETRPIATKTDPLADVSFFDLDVPATKNGSSAPTNGLAAADAVSRVRRRRAASAYAQRNSA